MRSIPKEHIAPSCVTIADDDKKVCILVEGR